MMTASEIRRQFIDFFRQRGHTFVPSSPVVPHDDPTLLFTNAAMNQFKDVFLETGRRDYRRAVNSQKCIRAGGKHNDLDDVGHDTYHHTFFEMLGNWSFGDYFKKEAIRWAWELLTEVWKLPKDRLHATVFEGDANEGLAPDDEAAQLWRSVTDIAPTHIHKGNKKDNFWEMGDTGPCGPCSEIHIDLTPDKSGRELVNQGDPRVMEIWNLVFIQFNRGPDGKLTSLPAKHVDTGMGLERVAAVIQGKKSNYDTDLFTPIFAAIQRVTGAETYGGRLEGDQGIEGSRDQVMRDVAYRVIADHIRTLTFALTDGAVPSNEGRGYVLRRILRRASMYSMQHLNVLEPFLHKLVAPIAEHMVEAFPELHSAHGRNNVDLVSKLIREEEEAFDRTKTRGIDRFMCGLADEFVATICRERGWRRGVSGYGIPTRIGDYFPEHADAVGPGDWDFNFIDADKCTHGIHLDDLNATEFARHTQMPLSISGSLAFQLHDTHGFPIDLTVLMAGERGLAVDLAGYERLMDDARSRARLGQKDYSRILDLPPALATTFGDTDDSLKYENRELVEMPRNAFRDTSGIGAALTGQDTQAFAEGSHIGLAYARTCFYAEQGGQVGDTGVIRSATGSFEVEATRRAHNLVIHFGHVVSGTITLNQEHHLVVDYERRRRTVRNHTATHVMNWALREVFGEHVQQKGSLVDPEKTRFDFTHNEHPTPDQLRRVEELVNERLYGDLPVFALEAKQEDALKINGLRAVFGERYPPTVRVVSIGVPIEDLLKNPSNADWHKYSVEFCGGTHARHTGECGFFKIIESSAVAKGVRRITAVTGDGAMKYVQTLEQQMHAAAELLKTSHDQVAERIGKLLDEIKALKKQKETAAVGDVKQLRDQLARNAEKIDGAAVILAEVPDAPVPQLREMMDFFREKLTSGVFVLGARGEGKCMIIASVTDDLVKKGLSAGDVIKTIAPTVGGSGGGKPTLAQAGGKDPAKIAAALDQARAWVTAKLVARASSP